MVQAMPIAPISTNLLLFSGAWSARGSERQGARVGQAVRIWTWRPQFWYSRMALKHRNVGSISFITGEMQIQTPRLADKISDNTMWVKVRETDVLAYC